MRRDAFQRSYWPRNSSLVKKEVCVNADHCSYFREPPVAHDRSPAFHRRSTTIVCTWYEELSACFRIANRVALSSAASIKTWKRTEQVGRDKR